MRRFSPLALTALIALLAAADAGAMPARLTSTGQSDFSFGTEVTRVGGGATYAKPESKLFYTPDRRWWAVLGASASSSNPGGVYLYELVNHAWAARLRLPRSNASDKADTLFDAASGSLLVTLRDNSPADSGRRSRLYRLSYRGSGSWTSPLGPTTITDEDPEALTIARDSARRLWAAWEDGGRIRVKATVPGSTWFSPVSLPASEVDADDLVGVVAFGTAATGRKIGIMWSDQVTKRFRFAWRYDRDKVRAKSWHVETAYGAGVGGCPTAHSSVCADDHVNLKAHGDEVYAAVKTGLNDDLSPTPNPSPHDPLIVLLRRSAGGRWAGFPVSPVSQEASRPIVLLAPERDAIWVFAQKGFNDVYVWESRFSTPGFDSSAYAPWTTGAGVRNDPTSTKQPIPAGLNAVVETSFDWGSPNTADYWHNEFLP